LKDWKPPKQLRSGNTSLQFGVWSTSVLEVTPS
jgi:hypothetical protein